MLSVSLQPQYYGAVETTLEIDYVVAVGRWIVKTVERMIVFC
jgi:hypothetical protein